MEQRARREAWLHAGNARRVASIAVILMLVVAGRVSTSEAAKPNVIVILSDDQGWGDLSHHGNEMLSTPRVDSLAKEGASFRHFYVQPVCSPTRAEFLTGRYHARGGVFSTSAGGERLDLDEATIGETFKAAGYHTAAFGKWHNGMQPPYHPNARGFDEYYGFCSGHWGNYFAPVLEHNGHLVQGDGFCVDDFTNHAIEFAKKHRDEPFFVYLPLNTPHSPMQVPDRFWKRFDQPAFGKRVPNPMSSTSDHTRAAYAMCENIDWNVGRILDALDELDLAENTIVVYFNDNGPNGNRWNGGMRGRKGSTDEGGCRSPLFVRWTGTIPAGLEVPHIAGVIDLLPTLADLCDIPVKTRKPLDGVSQVANLIVEPNGPEWPSRLLFNAWRGRVSVRSETHRLDHQGKLYDIRTDPGQKKDIAKQQPELAAELREAAATFEKEVMSELDQKPRPLPIGHADFDFTQLPARDAVATGKIERSNRFPNCSYFRNWTSTEETISFDAEVLTAGDYEVEIHYTCPEADVGSTIELSFGNSKVSGKITEPHDSPVIGAAEDRVKRQESYVKNFRPLKLGTIHLEPGRGPLVLKATDIPGGQVAEFRLLFLTRKDGPEAAD